MLESKDILPPERRLVSLSLAEQLDETTARRLRLLDPKEIFDRLGLEKCLAYQDSLEESLQEILGKYWIDPRIQFVAVCGRNVYTCRSPITEFDEIGFNDANPYLLTLIPRPLPDITEPPSRPWLRLV